MYFKYYDHSLWNLVKCSVLSFEWFPGVRILCDDVSEHCAHSIFIGSVKKKTILLVHATCEEEAACTETSDHKIEMPGYHTKERIRHSQQGESLGSRTGLMPL